MEQLSFHVTDTFGYPTFLAGGATAMTMCRNDSGDSFLAFLAQQPFQDQLVLVEPCEGNIQLEFTSPVGRDQIGGMGYSPINGLIYCGNGYQTNQFVTAIDPNDGSVVHDFEIEDPGTLNAAGFGTNGFFLARADGEGLELRTMAGNLLGSRTYPGRMIRGVSASPFSWTMIDANNNEIVVLNPFGQEIATAPAPGGSATGSGVENLGSGPHAIAFDYVNFPFAGSQRCIPAGGAPVDVFEGSPYDPNAPWDPAPWQFQHRIYIANQTTGTVYSGYLTAA